MKRIVAGALALACIGGAVYAGGASGAAGAGILGNVQTGKQGCRSGECILDAYGRRCALQWQE